MWVPIVMPVARLVSAAAAMTFRWTGASGSGSTAVLMKPGRTSVPSIPSVHSAIHCSASSSDDSAKVASRRYGSLYWPVFVTMCMPVRRASSRSTIGSRARTIGLQSTNDRTPASIAARRCGSIVRTTSSQS